MSRVFCLLLLFTNFSFTVSQNLSLYHSNCSLSFTIGTISRSNNIETDFPIELVANYNLTCQLTNLTAYYKITPLSILVIGQYKNTDENIKSMIELNSTEFYFYITQPSTVRLCILSSDDDDDEDDNDNDHRICRQIHIGINELYHFWSLPMQIFYIILICSLGTYHILFFLRYKWRKGVKKPKYRPRLVQSSSMSEKKHDTFENEKIQDDEASGEEDDEQENVK